MEVLDVVNEKGIPTGELVSREIAHQKGIKHRTAHIWIVRKNDDRIEVLLQKRSLEKDCYPGKLDTSSAGHIHAGDTPLESAQRELKEELGISAGKDDLIWVGNFTIRYEKVFHDKLFRDNEVSYVYLFLKPIDIDDLSLQKEEIDSVGWYDLNKTIENIKNGEKEYCVPIDGLKMIQSYLRKTDF